MNENNKNTYTKILWWLLGFFSLIVIGGTGAWINSIQNKIDAAGMIQVTRGERISALETVLPYIKERLDKIDQKLERIEEDQRRRR